jgi:hypothetical protein
MCVAVTKIVVVQIQQERQGRLLAVWEEHNYVTASGCLPSWTAACPALLDGAAIRNVLETVGTASTFTKLPFGCRHFNDFFAAAHPEFRLCCFVVLLLSLPGGCELFQAKEVVCKLVNSVCCMS